jgi:hypothetical protein
MVTRPRMGATIAAFAAGLTLACGEYAHRNPYDPETGTRIVITGPDTLWSISEVAAYTATVSPAVPGGAGLIWSVADPGNGDQVLGSRGAGSFQALDVGVANVLASVGRHTVSKRVVVRQRAARLFFFCPNACTSLSMANGTTRDLFVGQYDALGTGLRSGEARSPVTYSSRDPGIVAIVPGSAAPTGVSIRAFAPGTAYVLAQLGDWKDSVRVTVFTP